jgi:hypothetical protein
MTNTTPNRGRWTHVLPTTLARTLRGSLGRWPTVAALGLTGYIVLDDLSTGSDLAAVLAAAALVYLGAAALKKPATAWPLFWGAIAVIIATEQLVADSAPTWVLLGLAGLFVGYGLLRGAARPTDGLPLQTIAMIAFGATAAITLIVGGEVGAYLVAAGLLGHAAWDVWHHRANRVVVRSLAEFCFVLDTLLAAAIAIVAVRG